jgi:hypothetical protein
MKPIECEFEAEVLAAVLEGRWPEAVDAELRAHVAECGICSEVAVIAGAIEGAREEMSARAVIPDSGRVWWLAQRRARREAAESANRPITISQAIAFACAAVLLCANFSTASVWLNSSLRRIASGMGGVDLGTWFASAARLLAEHGALALAMTAIIFVLPAAVYLAISRD